MISLFMEELAYIAPGENRAGYKELLQKELAAHICPLCPDGLKMGKNDIIRSQDGWNLILNEFAYEHTRIHLLIIPEAHVTTLDQLSVLDWKAVQQLTAWAIEHFQIKGGALTIRFGDAHYSGASVHHLHFHLISPEHDESRDDNVVVPFAIGLSTGKN